MRMTDEEGRAFARRPGALPELVRMLKDPENEERAFMATLIGVAGGADWIASIGDMPRSTMIGNCLALSPCG